MRRGILRRRGRRVGPLVALLIVGQGCVHTIQLALTPAQVAQEARSRAVQVLGVVRTSGEIYQFSEGNPAVIINAVVEGKPIARYPPPAGSALLQATLTLRKSDVAGTVRGPDGMIRELTTSAGHVYKVGRILGETSDTYTILTPDARARATFRETTLAKADIAQRCDATGWLVTRDGRIIHFTRIVSETDASLTVATPDAVDAVSIPLSEVESVRILKQESNTTAVVVLVGVAVVAGVLALATSGGSAPPPPPPQPGTTHSCPFIYSFDGSQYVFDAEPYGGAIARRLARTEWCRLPHATEVAGRYRLRMTNELDETQNTDVLTLVVVDHPDGTRVAPDLAGRMHAFSHLEPPLRAVDARQRDLVGLVGATDSLYWHNCRASEADRPDDQLKEELTFDFPAPPPGVRTARLLVRAGNTLWASQMVGRYLSLYGSRLPALYGILDKGGKRAEDLLAFTARDELYQLDVRVETADGWKTRAILAGGSPLALQDHAYPLDVSDVTGDTLRIRLTPPATFWMIDSLAIDYAVEPLVKVTEVAAEQATDRAGRDLRALLAATDGRFFSMPAKGDTAEVEFIAPPRPTGEERSVFVKAGGYYRLHLRPTGGVQRATLKRFSEPGFPVRFALDQYRQFEQRQLQALAQQ